MSQMRARDWRAVEVELPPNALPVLVWDIGDEVHGPVVANYYYLASAWTSTETGSPLQPSHWMPITEPQGEVGPTLTEEFVEDIAARMRDGACELLPFRREGGEP